MSFYTDLNNFHWIDTFWWLLSDEASHSSILHIQTRMFLTRQLQQMHKVLVHQDVLLGKRMKTILIKTNTNIRTGWKTCHNSQSLTHMFISSKAVLGVFFTTLTKASAPSTVTEL